MTIDDDAADELYRSELGARTSGWQAPDRESPALAVGRRLRITVPAIVAAGMAALFLLAMGLGTYSLLNHRDGGPVTAAGPAATPSPSDTSYNCVGETAIYKPTCPAPNPCSSTPASPFPRSCSLIAPCQMTNAGCPTPFPTIVASAPAPSTSPSSPPRVGPSQPPQQSTGTCAAAELKEWAITYPASTFKSGDLVTAIAYVQNLSTHACSVPDPHASMSCSPAGNITRDGTNPPEYDWYSRNPAIMAPCSNAVETLQPKGQQNDTDKVVWTWDQKPYCRAGASCGGGESARGTYTVNVTWVSSFQAHFTLT
jgi:hypothetical protein